MQPKPLIKPDRPTLPKVPDGLNPKLANAIFAHMYMRALAKDLNYNSWRNLPFDDLLEQTIKQETNGQSTHKVPELPANYYRSAPFIDLSSYASASYAAELQAIPQLIPKRNRYFNWCFSCFVVLNDYWHELQDYRNQLEIIKHYYSDKQSDQSK